jgi:SAM-dependent methyltransferase
VLEADLEQWEPPVGAFDLVVSSLVLHYLPNLEAVVARAARALVPGGRLVCSVEHPVVTCTADGWSAPERETWLVDDYFASGPRDTTWLKARVIRYHRPLEDYVQALQAAGFVLDQLREARPRPERFADAAAFRRRLRVPRFLVLAGHVPTPEPPR